MQELGSFHTPGGWWRVWDRAKRCRRVEAILRECDGEQEVSPVFSHSFSYRSSHFNCSCSGPRKFFVQRHVTVPFPLVVVETMFLCLVWLLYLEFISLWVPESIYAWRLTTTTSTVACWCDATWMRSSDMQVACVCGERLEAERCQIDLDCMFASILEAHFAQTRPFRDIYLQIRVVGSSNNNSWLMTQVFWPLYSSHRRSLASPCLRFHRPCAWPEFWRWPSVPWCGDLD